jgi:DNA-3-methyladenine glycosylase
MNSRLTEAFFRRDVLEVAPELLGKTLVRRFNNNELRQFVITEVEAYSGDGDRACHASKGSTPRTEVMFREGGLVYVYLIYGIHWLLNVVTGNNGDASAVLIRGIQGFQGPGRVGKALSLDKTFYGENLASSNRIWIEDTHKPVHYMTTPRIGISYAGEPWVNKPWRYILIPG